MVEIELKNKTIPIKRGLDVVGYCDSIKQTPRGLECNCYDIAGDVNIEPAYVIENKKIKIYALIVI